MIIKNQKSYLWILGISSILSLTTCKKYPEDTIWFKNVKHIPVLHGYITEYIVNGIDSINLLNDFYQPIIPNGTKPYNNTIRDLKKEVFQTCCEQYSYWHVTCDLYERLNYRLSDDKKSIKIGGSVDTLYFKKQLFLSTNGDIIWKIQYLDKHGKKSKIKTTYNGNTYEITFQN